MNPVYQSTPLNGSISKSSRAAAVRLANLKQLINDAIFDFQKQSDGVSINDADFYEILGLFGVLREETNAIASDTESYINSASYNSDNSTDSVEKPNLIDFEAEETSDFSTDDESDLESNMDSELVE